MKTVSRIVDDDFKWRYLPDAEARVAVPAAQEEIDKQIKEGIGEPFSRALRSITSASYSAHLHRLRQTALFRAIEALRMYVAEYGRFPDKLEDVAIVPIPRDPYTDKYFEYSGGVGAARLSTPHDETWTPRAGQSSTSLSCSIQRRRRRSNGRAAKIGFYCGPAESASLLRGLIFAGHPRI